MTVWIHRHPFEDDRHKVRQALQPFSAFSLGSYGKREEWEVAIRWYGRWYRVRQRETPEQRQTNVECLVCW
ncbi:hypothetical protein NDU88_005715 [Pleurodeles waltl]|uniref:Uncharacterized protein n=1 Tax=Pleurodeles waltl TaxID=8319 RepID=A0AAV7TWD6_PLEWA|nr:hypothetical protein NDU88_005715 [Pleurodeles waltl]